MKPVHRNRRISTLLLGAIAVLIGTFLLLQVLNENKQLFKHPSDVLNPSYVSGPNDIRIGGLVAAESVIKGPGLATTFRVIDFEHADPDSAGLKVRYDKVLPDLFREGQGVVVTGRLNPDGVFIANNVLAKHDENYMPKMPEKVDYATE
ncbi:MAG: cytochrome c maturation protein CcmE [Acidimicrobiales bacterium]|nr:cytochrome c maturation protein CcmE [Hyphomonadaceae bacterium]RZV42732.1 MAG: cytochrome c maturation protein CcmE [Acidimicrobiales bacterium]